MNGPIVFIKQQGNLLTTIPVSDTTPLPVIIGQNEYITIALDTGNGSHPVSSTHPLPVRILQNAETLLVSSVTVSGTNQDLLKSTAAEQPTLDHCMPYAKLLWTYYRTGGETTTYRVLARATDHHGAPLANGWLTLETGTLPGAANSWNRIEIPLNDLGHYDQYRIEVQRTAGTNDYTLLSKIVGVR